MLNVNSNIDKFITNFQKRRKSVSESIDNINDRIADRMIADMITLINSSRATWEQPKNTIMERLSASEMDFVKIHRNGVCTIQIDNGDRVSTKDGTLVNPYFFVEFGFGIKGEDNPKQGTNGKDFTWRYNVNNHQDAWLYMGNNGEFLSTEGQEGINFMYNTLQAYQNKWQQIVMEEIKRSFK